MSKELPGKLGIDLRVVDQVFRHRDPAKMLAMFIGLASPTNEAIGALREERIRKVLGTLNQESAPRHIRVGRYHKAAKEVAAAMARELVDEILQSPDATNQMRLDLVDTRVRESYGLLTNPEQVRSTAHLPTSQEMDVDPHNLKKEENGS